MDGPRQQTLKLTNKNHRTLPILDYYLTFIHFFGFSINPHDDHKSRYLSIRVRTQRRPAFGGWWDKYHDASRCQPAEHRQWLASYTRRARQQLNSLPFAYLKSSLKYMAISFNAFIAANHCIVLVDYICTGSRGIEDIILEIRLVMTKLSALIFVLSWHHKQHEVRQLIKLVKSTSLYILATHGSRLPRVGVASSGGNKQGTAAGSPQLAPESPFASPSDEPTRRRNESDQHDEVQVSDEIGSSLRLDTREFDKRILRGWFGCLFIILIHFSLSEAEISKSHHLWQWLDDYSLHQLGNQSVSRETLMFLATFDNYIYTVHVYGTRLIGASIICIVCSLQHEVIKSLNLYTLRLLKKSHHELLRGGGGGHCATLAPPGELYNPGGREQIFKRTGNMFFVLGESDWFRVRHLRDLLEPRGHLTQFMWAQWIRLRRQLALHFVVATKFLTLLARKICKSVQSRPLVSRRQMSDRVTPMTVKRLPPQSEQTVAEANKRRDIRPTPLKLPTSSADLLGHASSRHHLQWPTEIAAGRLTLGSGLSWSEPLSSSDDYHARLMAMLARVRQPQQQTEPTEDKTAAGARKIELQMERLSTKYELVRTVNARIDAFFGPMLLVQFSFLFLMSCIDLVFFSLCFNPNTKTKYIIISGMILLWCPYMLIYKFASDMGSSSCELLVSIRRLARLYLLEDQASLASTSPGQPLDERHFWSGLRFQNYNLLSTAASAAAAATKNRATTRSVTPEDSSNKGTQIGAGILDKLDHIFKPTHLSIMGIMTVDKFFLLNFAKIVITSSVMMIQFISN